jgi:hypothetical protein
MARRFCIVAVSATRPALPLRSLDGPEEKPARGLTAS